MIDIFNFPASARLITGRGGFPMLEINNQFAHAVISLYAGQVLSYQPKINQEIIQQDLLFVSERAYFNFGQEIKGGIPICWPWFGPDPENQGRAGHGFARMNLWELRACTDQPTGETLINLNLNFINQINCDLALEIKIGATLELILITRNLGVNFIKISQGFHTYFQVSSAPQIKIHGLAGCNYLNKAADAWDINSIQDGLLTIDREINRIYYQVPAQLTLEDPIWGRRIQIEPQHSQTCVVWNPWIESSFKFADLAADDYQHFVCIETVHTATDEITIAPGQESYIGANYSIESLI